MVRRSQPAQGYRASNLVESLLSSRRALAESSKLIQATDELRNKLRREGKVA